jgi:PEP-CTERM motif-containing protein
MKRSFTLTLGLVVWMSVTAFAGRIYLQPNDGSGDNFAFVGITNRHQLVLSGGTDPYFFSTNGYEPGSTLQLSGALYLYDSSIWFNGSFTDFSFSPGSIDMSKITLPSDGRSSFRAFVNISFSATGVDYVSGQSISVGESSNGWIPFHLGSDGLYYADGFIATPEPGTWSLMGTGFIAILALARKRLRA